MFAFLGPQEPHCKREQLLGWQLLSQGFEQQIPLQVKKASTIAVVTSLRSYSQHLDASVHVEVITPWGIGMPEQPQRSV